MTTFADCCEQSRLKRRLRLLRQYPWLVLLDVDLARTLVRVRRLDEPALLMQPADGCEIVVVTEGMSGHALTTLKTQEYVAALVARHRDAWRRAGNAAPVAVALLQPGKVTIYPWRESVDVQRVVDAQRRGVAAA